MSESLSVIDGASLLALDVEPPRFIVARLIPTGLHLLAGSPKTGKSWLALWLCHQIASGGKVWEFDTQKSGALYISLEDTLDRLHLRLSRITEHGSKDIFFATAAGNLANGLIEQLEAFTKQYPDTGLIVIDTFQRIRDGENESTYANDYREVVKIKAFADRLRIAVLLVHHLRKMPDSDPFNMVSGSTGIIGAVDSIYVLEKQKRIENAAVLHVTGRDIEDMQIKLELDRDPPVWRFVGYGNSAAGEVDGIIRALCAFMSERAGYTGTAGELFTALRDGKALDVNSGITANNLTRKIKEHLLTLEKSHHIKALFNRSKAARLISLSKVNLSVTGDGDIAIPFLSSALPSYEGDGNSEMTAPENPPSPDMCNVKSADCKAFTDNDKPVVTGDGNFATPTPITPEQNSRHLMGVHHNLPSPVTNDAKAAVCKVFGGDGRFDGDSNTGDSRTDDDGNAGVRHDEN